MVYLVIFNRIHPFKIKTCQEKNIFSFNIIVFQRFWISTNKTSQIPLNCHFHKKTEGISNNSQVIKFFLDGAVAKDYLFEISLEKISLIRGVNKKVGKIL